jgi:hypothetical protein
MAEKCYSPRIDRDLVSRLYHEAQRRGIPMTQLVDQLLRTALPEEAQSTVAREEPRQDYHAR